MERILSVEEMRKSDAATIESGTPGRELMQRAAAGIYSAVCDSFRIKGPVAIVCGSGNNAGDGYALALILNEKGIKCTLFRVTDKFSGDGKIYYDKCIAACIEDRPVSVDDLSSSSTAGTGAFLFDGYAMIIDCLLGTGFKGDVRSPYKEAIRTINAAAKSGAKVVSADINSGLNGDNGMGREGSVVISDLTVSIGSYQPGHFLGMAKDCMRKCANIDIGINPVPDSGMITELFTDRDIPSVIPQRKNLSNKSNNGYIVLMGGSPRYGGAIRLACLANAAMRSGAGVVKVCVPSSLRAEVSSHILESTLFPFPEDENGEIAFDPHLTEELLKGVKAVAFGMGIGRGKNAGTLLRFLLSGYTGRLIIDADGLFLLSEIMKEAKERDPSSDPLFSSPADVVLTPHTGEFSRLTGKSVQEILSDPIGLAAGFASENNVSVLLKGPSTVVAIPDKKGSAHIYLTDAGCPGMATAGSGDVLSGIIAALAGYVPSELYPICGAHIAGRAGELAQKKYGAVSMVASDTIGSLPDVLNAFCG